MAVLASVVNDRYAIYNGDSMDVSREFPDGCMGFSVYSPPFGSDAGGLYRYSSSERDLSNAGSYAEFFTHYGWFVREVHRLTMPGRITAVHCMDIPSGNSGSNDHLIDFPGDIIRLHQQVGFTYVSRRCIWKEPLAVRNRTLAKGLAHKTIVTDSTQTSVASADYLIAFRRSGTNPVPVAHPTGLHDYAGATLVPADLHQWRGWAGKQIENRYSHWIWRQYASSIWDDIRIERVLPFREGRAEEDERHVHPMQLDVIDRALVLWSNPGDRVWTPFMGVGSEVYAAVAAGRVGVGCELKPSYFAQAVANLATLDVAPDPETERLFT